MNKELILNGLHMGEHLVDYDGGLLKQLKERVIDAGFNYAMIRLSKNQKASMSTILEAAKLLRDNKIHFHTLYATQYPPEGKKCFFDACDMKEIKRIAGEYYLGEAIGEPGTSNACKLAGYFRASASRGADPNAQKTDSMNMEEAHNFFVAKVKSFVDTNKEIGIPESALVEATALTKYSLKAGVGYPLLEVANGNPDELMPTVRGASRGMADGKFGTYIAHEWYGGVRHSDTLKRKRLELEYKFAYLSGAGCFCLESGDECLESLGQKYEADSELCEDYRRVLREFNEFIKNDDRPSGGPKVKVAFVSGLYDAWGGWCGSAVWNQFGREEWGWGDAEHSWRMLDELGTKRKWADCANYGEHDFSATPAYGMYDIVPIESSLEALKKYDYLIFVGWNTMTDENMDKLTEYVKCGGHVLMSLAHLNYNSSRNGNKIFPSDEKLKKLFGINLIGKTLRTNNGSKFCVESLDGSLLYPGIKNMLYDPMYSSGYTEYAYCKLLGAKPLSYSQDSFGWNETDLYSVIENKAGDGVATLVMSIDYPGRTSLYPLYRAIVREIISASARNCEIKVIGNDRLRYSVYDNNEIYLLNTDYDLPINVKILYGDKEYIETLESLELKKIKL